MTTNALNPVSDFRRVPLGRRLLWGAAIGALAGGGAFLLGHVPPFSTYEAKTLDWRHEALARRSPAVDDVVLVMIDDYSIETVRERDGESFPWSRYYYEAITKYLKEGGAKAIVYDMIFADPSRYGQTRKDDGKEFENDDTAFAEAVRAAGNVVLGAKLAPGVSSRDGKDRKERKDEMAEAPAAARETVAGWSHRGRAANRRLLAPIPGLAAAAAGIGAINVLEDADGTLRRADLVHAYGGAQVASLALSAARLVLECKSGCALEDRCFEFAGRRIPVAADGRMLVKYYGPPRTFRRHNAAEVVYSFAQRAEGKVPQLAPEVFKDKVVLIGVYAAGLEDIVPAPWHDKHFPGVEFNATVIANILGDDFLREPPLSMKLGLLLAVGVLGGMLNVGLWRPVLGIGATAAFLASWTGVAIFAFRQGVVLDLFLPALALGIAVTGSTLRQYFAEGRMKREVSRAFGQYLSPVVIRDLLKDPDSLRLGGEMREITVFFSDLEGFSAFSERMDSRELVSFLNVYLSAMTDIILERRGLVDKYQGDAIMAFWGAPAPVADHTVEACLSALEQRAMLHRLNERFRAEGRPELHFRAGLTRGPAVVGNMGSTQRFNYTAMGDTVNLASRLEGANKVFGTAVLLNDAAYRAASHRISARRLGKVRVVGRSAPAEVYELVGKREEASAELLERLEMFERALCLLQAGDIDAAEKLFGFLRTGGDAVLLDLCLAKCREVRQHGGGWDGVWVLGGK